MKQKNEEVTAEDIAKLPPRYRRYIASLKSEVERLGTIHEQQERSRVILDPLNSDRFVPEFLNIRYVMGPNEKGLGNNIDVRLVSNQFDDRSPKPDEPGVLSIYGSRTLKIIPAVSNVVYIGLEPR